MPFEDWKSAVEDHMRRMGADFMDLMLVDWRKAKWAFHRIGVSPMEAAEELMSKEFASADT